MAPGPIGMAAYLCIALAKEAVRLISSRKSHERALSCGYMPLDLRSVLWASTRKLCQANCSPGSEREWCKRFNACLNQHCVATGRASGLPHNTFHREIPSSKGSPEVGFDEESPEFLPKVPHKARQLVSSAF
eukprot:1297503-Amphidinium_carterae.1